MIKVLLVCAICVISMTGCEKEKQASIDVGAKPKQIIDKVTTDINAATAAATENLKAAEDEAKSEN